MRTQMGLLGIVGIWLTMAMMPTAELLPLDAYQLLALRGAPGMVVIGLAALTSKRLRIELPDRMTALTAAMFVVACIGLFQAIKAWGTNLSAVMLDMAVLVNFLFVVSRGERVSHSNFWAFVVAIIGSSLALRVWDTENLNITGLLWGLLALTANGLCIEYGSRAKQNFPTKIFWFSVALVITGFAFSFGKSWNLNGNVSLALWFGVTTGLLNFICAFIAFSNLKAVWTGTLVLGVTPSILIGSWFITGRMLGWDQLFGITIVISSIGYLGYVLSKTKNN